MSAIKTYRDLIAWQKAMELVEMVYRETVQMPREERYELTNQMRRSAVSIPSNIAEGFGRQSSADFLKFLRISRGSLNEMATQYELAIRLKMLQTSQVLTDAINEVDRILQGLIKSIKKRPK